MKHEFTLYDILEISARASPPVIRAAYRCLTQGNHPDKKSGSAAAGKRQAQINHAYFVLSDPDQRQRYDQTIELRAQFVERRGRGGARGRHAEPRVADQQVSRPFVFRPLA